MTIAKNKIQQIGIAALIVLAVGVLGGVLTGCSGATNEVDGSTFYFYDTEGEVATIEFYEDANGAKFSKFTDAGGWRSGSGIDYSIDGESVSIGTRTFTLGEVDGIRTLTDTNSDELRNYGTYYEDIEVAKANPQERSN